MVQSLNKQQPKSHPIEIDRQVGRVVSLTGGFNYGTLLTEAGNRVYFHRTSFNDKSFEHLVLGSKLEFLLKQGPLGPQAIDIVACLKNLSDE